MRLRWRWQRGVRLVSLVVCGAFAAAVVAPALAQAQTADLYANIGSPTSQAGPGDRLEILLFLTNNGPDAAPDVHVTMEVPADVVVTAAGSPAGPCAFAADAPVDCALGTVAANTGVNALVQVTVKPDAQGGHKEFVVTKRSTAADPEPANDRNTFALTVFGAGACANPIMGTPLADRLLGTAFGDAITAGDGDDRLFGLEGADCLLGEDGNDMLDGGDGADRLRGGNGGDRLIGGGANDRLAGGSGADRLDGGRGHNRYAAGAGDDAIYSRNGRRDLIDCGSGSDRARVDLSDRVRRCEHVYVAVRAATEPNRHSR